MGKEKIESVLKARQSTRDSLYKNDFAFDLEPDMVSSESQPKVGSKGGQVIFGDYGTHFYGRLADHKKTKSADEDEFWLEDE